MLFEAESRVPPDNELTFLNLPHVIQGTREKKRRHQVCSTDRWTICLRDGTLLPLKEGTPGGDSTRERAEA